MALPMQALTKARKDVARERAASAGTSEAGTQR
jgi:hypothetical protein